MDSGTIDVFLKMVGWNLTALPGESAFEMPMRMFGVTGAVSLAGALTGVVYINLSDSFAEQAAQQVLGETASLPAAEVNDVVGELTNMISGNIKSKVSDLGYPCRLSIPSVMRGAPVLIDTKTVPIRLSTNFASKNSSEILTVQFFARLDSKTV
jgi:CheY-specific phosphatase CheX